ncbi:hypothetical protein UFOVP144_35 [uncultured Caudovirales phage]|uniref:Uncharacterized protein n=1 Tax=uncultured Caudovirales phage TaxID=2100421 RepID=A0A6J7XLW9_9CAUD|nr:hypothetical protein UFOVP144_35 [uncultured Caudovirales phage]
MSNKYYKEIDANGFIHPSDRAEIIAYNRGTDAGINAADWAIQYAFGGRVSSSKESYQNAKAIAKAIADGDPAFYNGIELPNLSGQWADGLTPDKLLEDIMWDLDDGDIFRYVDESICKEELNESIDELCSQWEMGVNDGFTFAMEERAKEYIKEYEDQLRENDKEFTKRYPDYPEEEME